MSKYISVRDVKDSDLPTFFEHQRDTVTTKWLPSQPETKVRLLHTGLSSDKLPREKRRAARFLI